MFRSLAPAAPAAPDIDGKQQKLVKTLQEWLEPTKYNSPGGEYAKHIRAYMSGTGSWVRKSPEFRSWRGEAVALGAPEKNQQETGCLWVQGVPGSGKSVFSASIVQLLQSLEPGAPVLFFFFRQIEQRNHDPTYLVRDFAAQLLPCSPGFRDDLQKLSATNEPVDGMEMRQIWDALLNAIEAMEKVYCVVDALDEMDNEHFDFIRKLRDLGLRDQRRVKVLLTSRPVPSIGTVLRDPSIVEMKLQPSMMYPDIVKYVKVRLGSLIPRLSLEKEQLVRDTICQRAQGLFLHARLITDSLTESLKMNIITEQTLPDSLERLPTSLQEFYEQMLVEHATRSGVDQEHQVRILSCVINASRPMRVIELGSLIAQMCGQPGNLKKGKTLVQEGCGRLLEVLEDESVSVIHHSFTEFLQDVTRKETRGAFPVLDSTRAHREMAIALLEYLDSIPFQPLTTSEPPAVDYSEDGISLSDTDSYFLDYCGNYDPNINLTIHIVQDLRLDNPLMDYALSHWAHHVKNAQYGDPAILSALHKLIRPGRPAFELSVHELPGDFPYHPGLGPIHLASHLGLVAFVKELIETDPLLLEAPGRIGCTPLAIAAAEDQTEVAKLLLDHGANPDCADDFGCKPMHHCALSGSAGVARVLLDNGVSPLTRKTKHSKNLAHHTSERNDGDSALIIACGNSRSLDVFDVFVPYLRPEDVQECLHWVSDVKRLETILSLGVASIDKVQRGKTALFKSADRRDDALVELLLKYGAHPNKRCSPTVVTDEDGHLDYSNGPTPIHALCDFSGGRVLFLLESTLRCLQLLLDAGGDINAKRCAGELKSRKDDDGFTPLHLVVIEQWLDYTYPWKTWQESTAPVTKFLIQRGADLHAQTTNSNTPAHYAATSYPDVFEMLIENGADLSKRNNEGLTPLLRLLSLSNHQEFAPETLDVILSAGGDASAVDNKGNSSIHYLMASGRWPSINKALDLPLFKKLVNAGADLNRKNREGVPPLHFYTATNDEDVDQNILQELIEDGLDINARDDHGRCVLAILLKDHNVRTESIAMFVRLGADVNSKDNSGEALLQSVLHKKDPMHWIQFLVSEGADYMIQDSDGNTLIQLAIDRVAIDKVKEVIDYLLRLGVPKSKVNSKGQTELHLSSAIHDIRVNRDGLAKHPMIGILRDYSLMSKSVDEADKLGATPLHYAASICEQNIGRLLEAGADPTRLTNEGASPLHIAAIARQPNIVGVLLSEYKKKGALGVMLDLQSSHIQRRTALHYACRSGRTESVRYLIDYGANVHAVDGKGLLPLHAALEFPDESLLWENHIINDYLIQLAGDIRPRRNHGSARSGPGPESVTDIISMLAEAGCDLDAEVNINGTLMTPLDIAIQNGFEEMAVALVELGASSHDGNAATKSLEQPAMEAEVQLLFDLSNRKEIVAETNTPQSFKTVPDEVFSLLRQGKHSTIREFARRGGSVLTTDEQGDLTTAHFLAAGGYSTLVRLFREQAISLSDVEWVEGKVNPRTLLGAVCSSEMPNLPMIKLLVEEFGLDVNEVSQPGGFDGDYKLENATPLHSLGCGVHWWQIEALEYLLRHGGDIEACNAYGETPLLTAISSKYPTGFWKVKTVKLLLDHGASVNARTTSRSPGTCLATSDDVAITRLLLQYGADAKDPANSESLTRSVELLDEDMTGVLLEAGQDANLHTRERYPLHEAARRPRVTNLPSDWIVKRTSMINLLLSNEADPFSRYPDGETIFQAVIEKHGVVGPFLDLDGLDVEQRGSKGRTLLISACVPTSVNDWSDEMSPPIAKCEAISGLIKLGASVDALDDQGRTALHWLATVAAEFSDKDKTAFNALLEADPSLIHVRDSSGSKPLHLALQSRQTWAVQRFVDTGADITEADRLGNNALHYYAPGLLGERTGAAAAASFFEWLLAQGLDIEARNAASETPLFVFVSSGWEAPERPVGTEYRAFHDAYLDLFIEAGADITTKNASGATLLHAVAGKPQVDLGLTKDAVDTFQRLLELGADPRAEDSEMRSAIDCAVARNRTDIIRLFGGDGKEVSLDDEEDDKDSDGVSEPGYTMVESE
ncbi:hypothetical protein FZEAL_8050 [Fusarium zealandicum]|uniref:NACHT domain-containing protein n=1 Tax=Fusarium zealandicum TaxID=1053134 RepID=A0A8H4XI17_9HYPO|nr:hypothetical protein FZEAL_8050 [Fusarium zealandicum]